MTGVGERWPAARAGRGGAMSGPGRARARSERARGEEAP
jgi:hypothetical protein